MGISSRALQRIFVANIGVDTAENELLRARSIYKLRDSIFADPPCPLRPERGGGRSVRIPVRSAVQFRRHFLSQMFKHNAQKSLRRTLLSVLVSQRIFYLEPL